ncbi:rRNA maturation RNase YbeY [uncultured Clostridium sp.]|uniref:rRNA maturation RNase YbeY n=1 Tax=uncultured Clostridium sp. TaxID=59620 RepID=UPI0028EE52EF|nr:rRNA maturation RNase YbeY [uncultured Clostridium sp.]
MIYIDDRQDKIKVREDLERLIERLVDYSLKEEGVSIDYEVSILFVDNENIREINREERGKDSETDVLSFPMLHYPERKVFKEAYLNYEFKPEDLDEDKLILGDIVLSLQKADEQRLEFNHSFEREVCYLIIHSILHLLGYDHMEDDEKALMRKREEEILNKFNIVRG